MKGGLCLGVMALCSFVAIVMCTMLNGTAEAPHAVDVADDARHGDASNGELAGLRKLSRRKRYVAFPEGSSFSVAFCLTIGFVGNPVYTYFSWSTNWGVAYDLPNETWILGQNQNQRLPVQPRPVVVRRHRRDLYERLETVIDNMGYAGKQCVLRALCEAPQYFGRKKSNLAVEMVRTIFSMPRTKVLTGEHADVRRYDEAQRHGRSATGGSCERRFDGCNFSLLDFALGEYMRSNSWFK